MSGKTIKDRYFIEDLTRDKLGSGAFGQVYSLRQCYAIDQKTMGLILLRHYQTSFPIGLPHSTSPSENSVMPASNSSKLSSGKV
jgi:hypothetical protein